jgi:hypothetical protein
MGFNMPFIDIYAPDARLMIVNTDMQGHVIKVTGDPKIPFIIGVKFSNCTIIADNLRAFDTCYFDQTCTMKVERMSLCGVESINNNAVIITDK